jgi:hypothetical protein
VEEVDVIVNGRVVERDFYQAGHLVERDTARPSILERDIITSDGRLVERDYMVRSATDRQLVGLSGKTVERQRSADSLLLARPASPVLTGTRPLVVQASPGQAMRPSLVEYDMIHR